MLVIRLTRIGKKNAPQYRIVVQEKLQAPSSKYLDQVGFYNPLTEPSTIKLEEEKIKDWISKGAQPSNTVWNMLVNAGIVKGKKRKAVKVKVKKGKESEGEKKEGDAKKKDEAKPEESKEEVKKEEVRPEEKKEDKPEEKKDEKPEKPKEEPKKEEKDEKKE